MSKFANGLYVLKNPQKYRGTRPLTLRSSWEMPAFQNKFDKASQANAFRLPNSLRLQLLM